MVVSNTVASNAPASLTPAQIVGHLQGQHHQLERGRRHANGVIAPKIPQTGSGTRTFFDRSARRPSTADGRVTRGRASVEVQEHDDAPIKSDPNAIAPFSIGRANLLGTTLRVEAGCQGRPGALQRRARRRPRRRRRPGRVRSATASSAPTAATPLIEAGRASSSSPRRPTAASAVRPPRRRRPTSRSTRRCDHDHRRGDQRRAASARDRAPRSPVTPRRAAPCAFYEGATAARSPACRSSSGRRPRGPHRRARRSRTPTGPVFTPAASSAFDASEGTGTGHRPEDVAPRSAETVPRRRSSRARRPRAPSR